MDAVRVLTRKVLSCTPPSPVKPPYLVYVEGHADDLSAARDPRLRCIDVQPVPEDFVLRTTDGDDRNVRAEVPELEPAGADKTVGIGDTADVQVHETESADMGGEDAEVDVPAGEPAETEADEPVDVQPDAPPAAVKEEPEDSIIIVEEKEPHKVCERICKRPPMLNALYMHALRYPTAACALSEAETIWRTRESNRQEEPSTNGRGARAGQN